MGFEATITPNTTSGLADEGRNLDWAREGGVYSEGFDLLVLIGVSIPRLALCLRRLLSVVVGVSISLSSIQSPFDVFYSMIIVSLQSADSRLFLPSPQAR